MEEQPGVGQVRVASGLNFLAGVWMFFSPFILGYVFGSEIANALIVGAIVAVLAAVRYTAPTSVPWLSWINAALGVWLIISPFVLPSSPASLPNAVIVGIIIAALGTWSALSTPQAAF